MYYGAIKTHDIANGTGVRVSLFVSGCRRCCPECFNPETWAFDYGKLYTKETTAYLLKCLSPVYIQGLTLIGGEPLEPENQRELLPLVRAVRERFDKSKDIWCYTGCVLEDELLSDSPYRCEVTDELLSYIDVLVDGPFVEEEKSLALAFRGSANQRILPLREFLDTYDTYNK